MKRKKIIKIICLATLPFVVLILLRVFKILQFYCIPTTSMEPSLSVGKIVFSSNVPSINRGDVVVYVADPLESDQTGKPYFAICRLMGMPGDTVQIVDGLLFSNHKLSDDTNKLAYNFIVENLHSKNLFSAYQEKHKIWPDYNGGSDSLILNFSYKEIKDLNLGYMPRKCSDTLTKFSSLLFNVTPEKFWDGNNFGPIVVPPDGCFLIGDNRPNSADSRIRGFIKMENVVGKVLNCK